MLPSGGRRPLQTIEVGYCNVLSSTSSTASLQTYTYEVFDVLGRFLGWYPAQPSNIRFEYTVLGTQSTTAAGNLAARAGFSIEVSSMPFHDAARLRVTVPERVALSARVYDVHGRLVAVLARESMQAGSHILSWHGVDSAGRSVPSGMYLCTVEAHGPATTNYGKRTVRLLLVR